jgi:hypothetical protein
MLRKIILLFVLTGIFISVSAQEIRNDIIQVNYEKKSVSKAMILSSLFPGAGQFYANRRSITTYIFPIIEIGLWVGYLHYYNQGLDKEDEYEKWANQEVIGHYVGDCPDAYYMDDDPIYRYGRERHDFVVDDFLIENNNPSYDNHFRLDDTNTQHFYEDIGKYNKHIFGWADWFDIYASNADGSWTNDINWNFEDDANGLDDWIGMDDPANPGSDYYVGNESLYEGKNGLYSGMRAEYIEMRREARDFYKSAEIISFGLVFNHILSAFDAVRITRRYNLEYITNTSKLQIHLAPVVVSNELSPALFLTKRF